MSQDESNEVYSKSSMFPAGGYRRGMSQERLPCGSIVVNDEYPVYIAGCEAFVHQIFENEFVVSQSMYSSTEDITVLRRASDIIKHRGGSGTVFSLRTGAGLIVRKRR